MISNSFGLWTIRQRTVNRRSRLIVSNGQPIESCSIRAENFNFTKTKVIYNLIQVEQKLFGGVQFRFLGLAGSLLKIHHQNYWLVTRVRKTRFARNWAGKRRPIALVRPHSWEDWPIPDSLSARDYRTIIQDNKNRSFLPLQGPTFYWMIPWSEPRAH